VNILICTSQVPFTYGGGELHTENLRRAFVAAGYNAEIASVPFKWYPPDEIIKGTLAWRLLDLTEANGKPIDMIVGMKFPAYLAEHPRKVLWIMHQYRTVYDLWETPYDHLSASPEGESIRAFVKNADDHFIPKARKVFANSQTVADRLKHYNNIDSEPLYHPPPRADLLSGGDQGDYVFYPSRMEPPKRQDLLIQAAQYVKSPLRIVLAGGGRERTHYESLVRHFDVGSRVEIRGFVDEKEILELYSNALAVCYLPFDEDYGYVTLEAMYAGKPVVVATDSGGAREWIEDRHQGLIVEPEPHAIAAALDELYIDRDLARRLGSNGRDKILSMDLSWQHVIEKLVSAAG
jgi:glycosyltransferase involved in cell wall biosynthesis